jgi:hypothetical protein
MKLAAISGVNGPFSDADIRRVRRLALAARARGSPVARRRKGVSTTTAQSAPAKPKAPRRGRAAVSAA